MLNQKLSAKVKSLWGRFVLRNVHYQSDHKHLDDFYLVSDPWRMSSAGEQLRFAETNRLIRENFGHVGSILEIGCGEGHQSEQLSKVCDRLVGIDVSKRAVERARKRCPNGRFHVGDVFSEELLAGAPYDLVVACEVLYYMKDVPAALAHLEKLGRHKLVTYFTRERATLDPLVLARSHTGTAMIKVDGEDRWLAVWG